MDRNYIADKTGAKIINIPFDRYIKKVELEGGYVKSEINESNSGEENSSVINTEIATISNAGGGIIYIDKGIYRISSIILKSNITLYVSKETRLISLSLEENLVAADPVNLGVFYGENCKNISITGGGIISANGISYTCEAETTVPAKPLEYFNTYDRVIESRKRIRFRKSGIKRHSIIYLKNCKNVSVHDVILNESPEWTFVLDECDDVDIYNLVIDNHMYVANTDGIDIKGGTNIEIHHSYIASADDAIVLKPMNGEIKNVIVTDCELCSYANCFKIGTETSFDVENIIVKDCYFFIPDDITCGYSGIAVESADGSNIRNVLIENIQMKGISSPILIWLGKRLRFGNKKEIGSIQDVTIKNVQAIDVEFPSAITGCKDDDNYYEPTNIILENIDVVYRDTQEKLNIRQDVPEWSMADYPDIVRISHIYKNSHQESDYWDLPCYGVFVRYAKNFDYSSYKCKPRSCNRRPFAYEKLK